MNLHWLPETLRAVGIKVVTYPGWEARSHGDLREPLYVVWHHDASPVGDSPSVPDYMIRRWDVAAAPVWVDRYGTWHIIGSGVAWHAGRVLPGKPGNWNSVGIETDHTTGEDWPPALLNSLRLGTAAIFRKVGRSADALEFHKTVCSPRGRKTDPDGLNLDDERAAVAELMHADPQARKGAAQDKEIPDMIRVREVASGAIFLAAPGVWRHVNGEENGALEAAGIPLRQVNARQRDLVKHVLLNTVIASQVEHVGDLAKIDEDDLRALARAVNDELSRRMAV